MLLLFLGGGLQAQSVDLIEVASWTTSDLNASQLQRYQKFVNNYGINNIRKVKLNSLTAALDTNELVIPDPHSANPLTFHSQRVEFQSTQEFYWYGKLVNDGSGPEYGYLMLLSRDGERFGKLDLDERVFSIRDIGGKNILIDHSQDSTSYAVNCGGAIPPPVDSVGGDSVLQDNIVPRDGIVGACTASILVLYTPAAADRFGEDNIPNLAEESVELTNQALVDSEVPAFDLRFSLAGVERLEYSENNRSWLQVISDIRLGSNNNAPQLRNQYVADLVVLFIDEDILSNTNAAGGLAFLGPNVNASYAVVPVVGSNNDFTFQHEVGHLVGANHEPCDAHISGGGCCDDGGPNCAPNQDFDNKAHSWEHTRGWWRWKETVDRRTILYSEADNPFNPRTIPRYSNPEVSWLGRPTGIDDERDNARILSANGCDVANFRSRAEEELEFAFLGSHHGCGSQELCVEISTNDPVDWRWQYSYDGINFFYLSQYTGNEECITAQFPSSPEYTRYYGIEITSPDGTVLAQAPFFVTSTCIHMPRISTGFSADIAAVESLHVFPNPVNDNQFSLSFSLESEMPEATIEIVNILGNVVYREALGNLGAGHQVHKLNASLNVAGIYHLRMKLPNGRVLTAEFLKVN